MDTKFFTNQDSNTLFNKLEGIFNHNESLNNFDVLVGYFRSSGYFKLRPLLENVAHIRILVGIDVDKVSADMHRDGLALFKGNADKTIGNWREQFMDDVKKANYDEATERGISDFIADMQSGKVQLKAHPNQNIHAKIYIFRPDNFNQHQAGNVITGSSNLTDAGLGTKTSPNYEFNVLLNDYQDIQFATAEFEKLWQEGVEILPHAAKDSLTKTHLAAITPYELYLKCLIEYFGSEVEFDPNSIKDLPTGFKRLSYQLDAVNQGWEMLKKHNGFFLADVVGLGKTVIATMIARQFYYHNGYPDYRSKILLVLPPALKQTWRDTLETFSLDDAVSFITNGSLHKVKDAKKYDMVIVDEAHKFRNDTAEAYDQLQRICKTKSQNNNDKKVILISATPLNNRPDDLYNQILLFQDGNNSTLDFPLAAFFACVKKRYKDILQYANKHKARTKTASLYEEIRQRVITPLMVRRTRTDLKNNNRYEKDLGEHGIYFPKTTPPKPIYYQLAPDLETLYDTTIKKIDNKKQDENGLLHTRYRALHYLKPELKQQYSRADFIAERLVAIMKTLLLKRMDSSFYAFKQTLGRFIKSSEAMLKMIKNNQIIIAPNFNVNEYILADQEDELMEALAIESLTDPSIVVCTKDDFEAGFIDGVRHDYQMLKILKSAWDKITIDPKIEQFLTQLPDFLAKDKNPEQKIVLFTESTDTMEYLSNRIKSTEYADKTLNVNAQNRHQQTHSISTNFDANIKAIDKKDDYQILITTDALAEGINLHRANTVINYDTPWNATKLIQRIGRVNRIGQTASHIFVYNFYPTEQIDDDIGLEKKALIKLQAFHSALGEDSQIYSPDEVVGTFGIFDENVQEETNETIPFLEEIRQFKKDDPEAYKRIKDMPNKVRNAVENNQYKNATLVFARTEDKGSSRFYHVSNTVENYGFINAAKLLKCTPEAKAEEQLPPQHYRQVSSAIANFNDELAQTIINQTQNKSLTPQETKAINYLKALLNMPTANADEQQKLTLAIKQIEAKSFQNLPKQINQLNKNSKGITPLVILESALQIITQYDLNHHRETEKNQVAPAENTEPSIIISQSYV